MMIPLIQPLMPPKDILDDYLWQPYVSNTWSNFGALYFMAVERLKAITRKFPVIVSSGTAGIDLALNSFEECNNVAVSDFTHAGSIAPVLKNGMRPILAGCDPRTMAMDYGVFERLCADGEIEVAIVVNPFGYGINRRFYADTARYYGVKVIFDYSGAWGDFDFDDEFPTVYSFHATKTLPVGEGGMVLYASNKEASQARQLSNFSTDPNRSIIDPRGYNFKVSELTCAMLCAQLDDRQYPLIQKRIEHRRHLYLKYATNLNLDQCLRSIGNPSLCVFQMQNDPAYFQSKAAEFGFKAQQYYIPLHLMPAYQDVGLIGRIDSELNRCIALPSDCTIEEAQTIIESVKMFLSTD